MTVEELAEKLSKIENKKMEVVVYLKSNQSGIRRENIEIKVLGGELFIDC